MSDAKILRRLFPGLKIGEFALTSPSDSAYNCIAWAADDNKKFWWPIDGYWPDGAPREETLEAFKTAFATLGYEDCNNVAFEKGFEKIAIYSKDGRPQHAARQLGTGRWTSKAGQWVDFSHKVMAIEGNQYGTRVAVMKRKIQS